VGALLAYYAQQLAELPEKPARHKQKRLILLRNHALLHTLYATAGRVAEVASLQRADVAEGRATQVEIVGKGGRRRLIFLTAPAQRAIQAYLQARDDTSAYLFVSHGAYREGPLTPQSIWQVVNRAAKEVFGADARGRPVRRAGPHAFRHLRAQHLSDEGMPITSLQALLGHASISTTRDIYAPKTPAGALVEELSTYGRDPNDVISEGDKAAERIRRRP
jgi:site-specific recombinase XerD